MVPSCCFDFAERDENICVAMPRVCPVKISVFLRLMKEKFPASNTKEWGGGCLQRTKAVCHLVFSLVNANANELINGWVSVKGPVWNIHRQLLA